MRGLLHDVVFSLRQLRKNPGFAAIAVITLALGIGANTAIFSLLNAVLLRNLPVQQPEQLVLLGKGSWKGSIDGMPNRSWQLFSYPFFREFRQKNEVFSNVAAIDSILFNTHGRVASGANLEKMDVELVSGTYFNTLGVQPAVGRVLSDADDQKPGGHPIAVASYTWWQRRFAKNANVVGQTVTLRSTVYTIVGVAAPEFFGVEVGQSPDLWIPLAMEKEVSPGWNGLEENMFQSLYVLGRRQPGVSVEQASANTNLLFRQILHEYVGPKPSQKQLDDIQHASINLTPAANGLSQLRQQFSAPLRVLMAVVALVLLVACANVANLLLARATARQREIAVRLSMGASRWRVARQLLIESTLLGAVGTIVGVWSAWWATHLLLGTVSASSGDLRLTVAPDLTVLGFTALVAILTVTLFGTAPALLASRVELVPSLKEGRGATAGASRSKFARTLIVGQVAVSLVLLLGAGLFLRSLSNLTNIDTGFNRQNVLTTSFDPDGAGYQQDARWNGVMQQVEERVNALPGVRACGFAFSVFSGGGWTGHVTVPGHPKSDHDRDVVHNIVGSGYLEAMGMPIVLGRGLLPGDSASSHKVAVINESMAREYFGGESPLGRSFTVGGKDQDKKEWVDLEVVGVVKDAKYMELREGPKLAAFYPYSQHLTFLYNFVVRYAGDATALASGITKAAAQIDPDLPVGDFKTLEQIVDDSVVNQQLVAELCAFFGGLATLLACIGIYGLMSYGVTRRTNEFGVRLALGSSQPQVLWLVLRETLMLVIAGILLGLLASPAINRFVESLLFGLKFYDPLSIGLAMAAMVGVAILAAYIPARRAAKTEPMVALRYE